MVEATTWEPSERAVDVGVAALAMGPSALWAANGASYLSDDFAVALELHQRGIVDGLAHLAFNQTGRPLAGIYYVLIYDVVGRQMVLQALVLGALNALVALVLIRALRVIVQPWTAAIAGLVFAVIPNRSATRLWFVTGPNLLALLAVLLAVLALTRTRPAVWSAGSLLVAGIWMHEGVGGLALLVILWWGWQDRPARMARAASLAAAVCVALGVVFALSPKRADDGPAAFDNLATATQGVLGAGVWGTGLATVGALVILVAVVIGAVNLIPSFRRSRLLDPLAVGGVLVLGGLAPFVAGGAPFATRGVFDRNNLVADVGVCVVLGTLLSLLLARHRVIGTAAVLVLVLAMGSATVNDVDDYRAATARGRELRIELVRALDDEPGVVLVVPRMDEGVGVEQYILNGDLTADLVLRMGPSWSRVSMPYSVERCRQVVDAALRSGEQVRIYQRDLRAVLTVGSPSACEVSDGAPP